MKVVAIKDGFYGDQLRREGDVFTIEAKTSVSGQKITREDQFSKKWMKRVAGNSAPAKQEPAVN